MKTKITKVIKMSICLSYILMVLCLLYILFIHNENVFNNGAVGIETIFLSFSLTILTGAMLLIFNKSIE
tara:strand:- start:415 stop:621 length:207 start_codon:yes stop_codon:yes gene_type:complete